MNKFLQTHPLAPSLFARAAHYVRARQKDQASRLNQVNDETALQLFPKRMGDQLRAELLSVPLKVAPHFAYLIHLHRIIFVDVCASSLSSKSFVPQEDLFLSHEQAKHLIIVDTGAVLFCSKPSQSGFGADGSVRLNSVTEANVIHMASALGESVAKQRFIRKFCKGDTFNEAPLWISFSHEGDLCSATHGHCFMVEGDAFIEAVRSRMNPFSVLREYAGRFLDTAIQLKWNGGSDGACIELLSAIDVYGQGGSGQNPNLRSTL